MFHRVPRHVDLSGSAQGPAKVIRLSQKPALDFEKSAVEHPGPLAHEYSQNG